jgi:hypothetical protein
MELTFLADLLLLWRHGVGRDEAHAGAADGEQESQAAASAGLAQGEVAEFAIDKLLLNDERVLTCSAS